MTKREPGQLANTAIGESISVESLQREIDGRPLYRQLADSEQPHFLLHGSILDIVDTTIPESETGRRSRKVAGSGKTLVTVLTDERVLVLIPRADSVDRIEFNLSTLESVTSESAPGGNERLVCETIDNIYRIDTSQSQAGESAAASEFVAESQPAAPPDTGDTAPLDALERLADLRERELLTEAEFAEKKAELLDRV